MVTTIVLFVAALNGPPLRTGVVSFSQRGTDVVLNVRRKPDVTMSQQSLQNAVVSPPAAQDPAEKPKDEKPKDKKTTFRIAPKVRFQGDVQQSYDGAHAAAGLDTFQLSRRRLGVEGDLLGHFGFEVERELTRDNLSDTERANGLEPETPWKDVYVNVDYSKAAQVQGGRFKIPFGLDQLTSISRNDFVFRSLGARYLAPSRDVGVMVHGRAFTRDMTYFAGVFAHDGDNARSKTITGADQTLALRLVSEPFRQAAKGSAFERMEIGTAFTTSALENSSFRPNGLRGRTVMTNDSFFDAVYVKGRRRRWEADLNWPAGPTSLRAEYTYASDDRLAQGLSGEDLPDARYRAWYVAGTYLLTGERKARPVVPRRELFRGGIGAIEVAGRYERIRFDSVGGTDVAFRNPRAETILPSGDRVMTFGANWFINRWLTVQVNAIREQIEDVQRSPVAGSGEVWSRVLRFQFVL